MAAIVIDREKCIGCRACVDVCPFDALSMEGDIAVVNEKCTLCRACLDVCPVDAISMPEPATQTGTPDLASWQGVWVWASLVYFRLERDFARGVVHSLNEVWRQ